MVFHGKTDNSFVGRDKEWNALVERCERAREGLGGLLLVEGEAGIGKSALMNRLTEWAKAHGFQTISGRYIGHHRVPPLSGLREAVSKLFSVLPTDSREIIEKKVNGYFETQWPELRYHRREIVDFLAPFGEDEGPSFDPLVRRDTNEEERIQRFYYFLYQLFGNIAKGTPFLVFLEDFHWADQATLDCAGYLAARIAHDPILLVGAYRPEEQVQSGLLEKLAFESQVKTIPVPRLGMDEVCCMAEPYGLGKHIGFCEKLFKASNGIPFFVEEWLNLWKEEHPDDPLSILSKIPKAVSQITKRRIGLLAEKEKHLLQAAAVIGVRFEPELLVKVSGQEISTVLDVLGQLEQRALVHTAEKEGSQFVFHHDTTHKVVYEGIGEAQRRILHTRVAEILKPLLAHQEERVFEVAHHYTAGYQPLKASQVLFKAGQRAFALRAYEDAQNYHTQALEMISEHPEETALRADIHEALGDATEELAGAESAKNFWERALEEQENALRRCSLYQKLSQTTRKLLQKMQYLQKALKETAAYPQSIERGQVLMGMIQSPRPDIADAEDRSKEAVQNAAQALRILRKHAPHRSLVKMLLTHLPSIRERRMTNMRRARRLLHQAINMAEELEDWEQVILAHLRMAETWRGVDLGLALQEGEKALAIAEIRHPLPSQEMADILRYLMQWSLALGDEKRLAMYFRQSNEAHEVPIFTQEKVAPEDAWKNLTKYGQKIQDIQHGVWILTRLQRLAGIHGKEGAWKQFVLDIREKHGELLAGSDLRQLELINAEPPEGLTEEYQEISVEALVWRDDAGNSTKKDLSDCNGKVIIPGPEVGLGWLTSVPDFLYSTFGDFVIETRISANTHPQRAGGIVVWQDKSRFIRFASGVDHIGQISLGWHEGVDMQYVGAGYLPQGDLVLRIIRQGTRYEGFVSADGKQWFTCGYLEFGHKGLVEFGLFAECNYEYGFPQPFPVRFENVKLWVEKVEEPVEEVKPEPSIKQAQIYPLPEVGELFYGMVGKSRVFGEFRKQLEKAARSSLPLLLTGETGTGKELAARAVHELSARKEKPFVPVNVAALSANLIESELFGHKKGAFTGANRNNEGLFKTADEGTIFLDEIGELPMKFQAQLLRILEQGEVRPVGDTRASIVDARCIAATNHDISREVAINEFRSDLFFRFAIRIEVPPLRERRDDIPLLVAFFIGQSSEAKECGVSREAMKRLEEYPWTGNVRELRNTIAGAAQKADDGLIIAEHLILPKQEVVGSSKTAKKDERKKPETPEEFEEICRKCRGNISEVARYCGVNRRTVYRWLEVSELDMDKLRASLN
jgi:two-component system, NtrC family, response regulator HydG